MPEALSEGVVVYASGLLCCSVCAPVGMSRAELEREVNRIHPCGTRKGWTISTDPTFASGQPNPCPCNDHPTERQHWLLEA